MIGQALYGSFIYGERIYREYVSVLLYDFGIEVFNIDNGSPTLNVNWQLYRRDDSISVDGLIDDTHIFVAGGTSIDELIMINLNDYSLRNRSNDFYIKAWKDDDIEHISEINIDYYANEYITRGCNRPYLYHKLGLVEGGIGGGCIEIEPNRWQLVTIPVQYGYWDNTTHSHIHDDVTIARVENYIVDQIEDVYGVSCDTMVEVFNAYIGDHNHFYNYVVGVTDEANSNNFELTFDDGICKEYTAFWVKSINPTPFTIIWGKQ